jgi:branched-chain amino acid transport system substrate-binding protein
MIQRRRVLEGIAATTVLSAAPGRIAWGAEPVKVGVITSTSGALASAGQAARRGAEIAGAYLKTHGAPPMELVFADTESRPENGRIAAEKLIREGCPVLIGAIDSGAAISIAQVAEAAKIPLVIVIASASQITESGYTQVFRNFPKSVGFITQAVQRIKEVTAGSTEQAHTAVLMYVNDTFGQAMSKAVSSLWTQLGTQVKILEQIDYDGRAKDLSVEVAKAKALNPDVLLTVARVNDGVLIVREMVKQNFNPKALIFPGSPGSYEKPFTDSLGKYGDDAINCVPWYDIKNPRTKDVLALSNKMFSGTRFELNSTFSFEAVEIVADALKRAGSNKPDAIHAALKATDIKDHIATGGPIQFDAQGQNNNITVVTLQNRKQEPIVVGPAQFATEPVRYPMVPFQKR